MRWTPQLWFPLQENAVSKVKDAARRRPRDARGFTAASGRLAAIQPVAPPPVPPAPDKMTPAVSATPRHVLFWEVRSRSHWAGLF